MRGTDLECAGARVGAEQEAWCWKCHKFGSTPLGFRLQHPGEGPRRWCRHASNEKVIAALSEVQLPASPWHMAKAVQRNVHAQVDIQYEAAKLSREICSKGGEGRGYPVSQDSKEGTGEMDSSLAVALQGSCHRTGLSDRKGGEGTLQQQRPHHGLSHQERGGGN